MKHQQEKRKHIRFTSSVQKDVETFLKEDYSPEQVVGTLKKQEKPTVSIERIYQHIWQTRRKRDSFTYTYVTKARYTKNEGIRKITEELSFKTIHSICPFG